MLYRSMSRGSAPALLRLGFLDDTRLMRPLATGGRTPLVAPLARSPLTSGVDLLASSSASCISVSCCRRLFFSVSERVTSCLAASSWVLVTRRESFSCCSSSCILLTLDDNSSKLCWFFLFLF